jgi:hypothetical protein
VLTRLLALSGASFCIHSDAHGSQLGLRTGRLAFTSE